MIAINAKPFLTYNSLKILMYLLIDNIISWKRIFSFYINILRSHVSSLKRLRTYTSRLTKHTNHFLRLSLILLVHAIVLYKLLWFSEIVVFLKIIFLDRFLYYLYSVDKNLFFTNENKPLVIVKQSTFFENFFFNFYFMQNFW